MNKKINLADYALRKEQSSIENKFLKKKIDFLSKENKFLKKIAVKEGKRKMLESA